MNTFRGTRHDGKVVFAAPTGLPEGTEVEVVPVGDRSSADEALFSADEIARTLAAMDAVEPFELTAQQQTAITDDRQARKDWEKARFNERAERLREIWE